MDKPLEAAWTVIYKKTIPLTFFDAGTPHAYGVVEVKRGLKRRAAELGIAIDPKFNSENYTFGAQAEALCIAVQQGLGVSPADGAVGPTTARAIFKIDLFNAAEAADVDRNLICKMVSLESNFDPAATNGPYSNGTMDKGIVEKNGSQDDDSYFDVLKSLKYIADRMAGAISKFGEVDVAIASYNVGEGGAGYYKKARDYIEDVNRQSC